MYAKSSTSRTILFMLERHGRTCTILIIDTPTQLLWLNEKPVRPFLNPNELILVQFCLLSAYLTVILYGIKWLRTIIWHRSVQHTSLEDEPFRTLNLPVLT